MTPADPYRNRDFIPDFDAIIEETAARSREVAKRTKMRKDVAYGPSPRQRMDIVFPPNQASGAPLHMFIHGGYWRAGDKETHTLVAAPVIAAGGIAAIVSYDLMPTTRLAPIVGQIRRAARFLQQAAGGLGADPARFTASGHSAGAHLASLLAAHAPGDGVAPDLPELQGLLLVSGVYDLSDIPGSFLRDETQMRCDEAAAWSPLDARHLPISKRIISLGEEETTPFHDQAFALHDQLKRHGMASTLRHETRCNHLTVVLDLADTNRPLGQSLADLVANI